ncbi:hypothetical protein J6590_059443 [Homalodisca vitripennis]|nr:hypothetical protein J6590_059443 [Homalodisca vitripennis]
MRMACLNLAILTVLSLLFAIAVCQKCPKHGETRKADPNNNCRYLLCREGKGRWYTCPQGKIFSESEQCCVWPSKSSSVTKSNKNSGNAKKSKNANSGNSKKQNSGSSSTGNSASGNGRYVADYHW